MNNNGDEMKTNKFGEEVIFYESNAVVQSLKNFWTRMASTYKCIQVILSQNHLIIKPHFFIGWIMYLLRLDAYHSIPINDIKFIERKGDWMGYKKLRISFTSEEGVEKDILLYVNAKESDNFLNKIEQVRKR
jgi:hypothetical protein